MNNDLIPISVGLFICPVLHCIALQNPTMPLAINLKANKLRKLVVEVLFKVQLFDVPLVAGLAFNRAV